MKQSRSIQKMANAIILLVCRKQLEQNVTCTTDGNDGQLGLHTHKKNWKKLFPHKDSGGAGEQSEKIPLVSTRFTHIFIVRKIIAQWGKKSAITEVDR